MVISNCILFPEWSRLADVIFTGPNRFAVARSFFILSTSLNASVLPEILMVSGSTTIRWASTEMDGGMRLEISRNSSSTVSTGPAAGPDADERFICSTLTLNCWTGSTIRVTWGRVCRKMVVISWFSLRYSFFSKW